MKRMLEREPKPVSPVQGSKTPGVVVRHYAYSLGIIVLITGAGVLIRDLIVPTNLVMPYLLGVVSIAFLWGRGPAVFASLLGVIAFDFFLVPPYHTLAVEDTEYLITFVALFIVGVLISGLTAERVSLNRQADEARLLKTESELQTTLLNSVSHDFRTPLVTIIGTLSSLDSGMNMLDIETVQKLVRAALSESEKLNRLVGNLLNMSRLESGAVHLELEPVDLQDLVGATLEDMKNRIDHEIRISVPEGLPLIRADFVLVQQALTNLVDNALKYSPEGAPVDIDIHLADRWVHLSVSDRGPGLEDGDLPYIFNKFYRIRDSHSSGGTGLGLAIVKGVIDAHSAEIDVRRREGGGMVFSMAFPQLEFAMENGHGG